MLWVSNTKQIQLSNPNEDQTIMDEEGISLKKMLLLMDDVIVMIDHNTCSECFSTSCAINTCHHES